ADFEAASGRWLRDVVSGLRGRAPVIVFAKGVHHAWPDLAATGANVLGVDHGVAMAEVAKQVPAAVALQGNLDPALLLTTPEQVRTGVHQVIASLQGRPGHIFNLGHGVPPEAKLENLAALVETVRATA
ncbi:MAG: uroporphyrinogen decarboxylase, partial [Verrucomicrobiae bacterium]|nr:uroporphyrinogen decarboxylase [Verrucomicrobiae bacterium]